MRHVNIRGRGVESDIKNSGSDSNSRKFLGCDSDSDSTSGWRHKDYTHNHMQVMGGCYKVINSVGLGLNQEDISYPQHRHSRLPFCALLIASGTIWQNCIKKICAVHCSRQLFVHVHVKAKDAAFILVLRLSCFHDSNGTAPLRWPVAGEDLWPPSRPQICSKWQTAGS